MQQLQQDVSDLAKENQSLIGRLRSSVALVRSLLEELAKSLHTTAFLMEKIDKCGEFPGIEERRLVTLKKPYADLLYG